MNWLRFRINKLLKENEILAEEYVNMLKRGGGIDSVRSGLNNNVKRLECVEYENLAELIQQDNNMI